MNYLIFEYKWNSRELKKIITAILKSWVADNIKKLNYIQDYSFNGKKTEKTETAKNENDNEEVDVPITECEIGNSPVFQPKSLANKKKAVK